MTQEIVNRINSSLVVLLGEEYGYRSWFWFPEMTSEELIVWWGSLETVAPYFMTPEPLPGTLIQVLNDDEFDLYHDLEETNQHFSGHIHCDDDSLLITPDGKKIYHKGYDG